MSSDVFESYEDMIEIVEVDQDHVVLYFPVAKAPDDQEHAWNASIRLDLTKQVAIDAGMPEEVFQLDEIHFQEYSGRKLSELLELLGHDKQPKLKFDIKF